MDLAASAEPAAAVPVESKNYWPPFLEDKAKEAAAVAAAVIAVAPVAALAAPAVALAEFPDNLNSTLYL